VLWIESLLQFFAAENGRYHGMVKCYHVAGLQKYILHYEILKLASELTAGNGCGDIATQKTRLTYCAVRYK
jgi:hypothetical protein